MVDAKETAANAGKIFEGVRVGDELLWGTRVIPFCPDWDSALGVPVATALTPDDDLQCRLVTARPARSSSPWSSTENRRRAVLKGWHYTS